MKKLLFLFGISFFAFSAIGTATAFEEENLYQRIYEDIQIKPDQMASERLALQTGVEISDIQALRTSAPKLKDLGKLSFCSDLEEKNRGSSFICWQRFQKLFASAELLASYEYILTEENAARNRWSNGTLSDSTFDIIVDLNVLDVLLFGPNATVPPAYIPGVYYDGRSRRYADIVAGLRRGDSFEGSTIEDPSESGGDGDGDGDGDFSGNICEDPDALFLTSFDGSHSSDEDNIFLPDQGNISDVPGELPDLAGERSDFLRGTYPQHEAKDPQDTCGENERAVPLFNGMYCVPEFCKDLFCVYTEIRPGQGFSLAPIETPACIECMIQRGYEVLSLLDHTVETPKKASNENYVIKDNNSLFGKIGMDFNAIPKKVPFLNYRSKTPLEDKEKDITESTTQSPDTGESANYKLAQILFETDCNILPKLSPESIQTQEEIFDFCTIYDQEISEESIHKILSSTAGDPSDIERYLYLEEHLEFAREIEFQLQRLKNDFFDFTNQIPDMTSILNDIPHCSKK